MRFHTPMRLRLTACALLLALTGCATQQPMDYSAFKQARPRSILVLPPVNDSPDVNATFSMLAQSTRPLAESGYYVMPVTLVNETFQQNGLHNPPEMHGVSQQKLREIFGADAAMYIRVKQYGATYTVFNSAAIVAADAQLVDLRSGQVLWTGSARASNDEGNNSNQGGLAGMLVAALVKQILNNVTDASHGVAAMTADRLFTAGAPNGLLYGPRSPNYGKDGQPR
jgi:hypothetical protein